jgi:hypothetical protein
LDDAKTLPLPLTTAQYRTDPAIVDRSNLIGVIEWFLI